MREHPDGSDRRTLTRWKLTLVLGGVFLIVSSYLQLAGSAMPWPAWVTLGSEMTLGAWWSSGLLLLAGMVALALASTARDQGLPGRLAFLGLGVVLVALSLDEIASLHERYDWSEIAIPRLLRLPPIALLIALTLAYALWQFWKHRGTYGSLWWLGLIAGFGAMGSIYAFELMEHELHWPESWLPARMAFEEGVELLGMGLLLVALMRVRLSLSHGDERGQADREGAWAAGLLIAAVAPLLIVLHHLMPLEGKWQHMGWPGLAAPSLLLLVTAFAAYAGAGLKSEHRWAWFAAAAVLLLGSLETTMATKGLLFDVPVDRFRPDLTFVGIGLAVTMLGLLSRRRSWWVVGAAVVAINLVGLAIYKTPIAQFKAAASAGLLLALMAQPGTVRQAVASRLPGGAWLANEPANTPS